MIDGCSIGIVAGSLQLRRPTGDGWWRSSWGRGVAALGKKQIGPRIDEERHSLLLGRLANDGDAACLPLEVVESRTFNDPVFKIDADHAQVEKTRDVVGQFALVFAIPALPSRR